MELFKFAKKLTIAAIILFLPAIANAAIVEPSACSQTGDCQLNDIGVLIVHLAALIIQLSGTLAFGAFIYGGVLWLISAGSSDRVSKGKAAMSGAVVGLLIVFLSYTIVFFVAKSIGVTNPGSLFQWNGFQPTGGN
jgi:hypothetical protein